MIGRWSSISKNENSPNESCNVFVVCHRLRKLSLSWASLRNEKTACGWLGARSSAVSPWALQMSTAVSLSPQSIATISSSPKRLA
eukprot:scaffold4233_cov180-Ochromonas_danica.AAC.29